MSRSSRFLAVLPLLTLHAHVSSAFAYNSLATRLNTALLRADKPTYLSSAFALYAQSPGAQGVLKSVAEGYLRDSRVGYGGEGEVDAEGMLQGGVTVVAPDNDSFERWIEGFGGNVSDPGSLMDGEWADRWAGLYPYFFVPGQLSIQSLTEQTTLVQTTKKSNVGNWTIPMALRRLSTPPTNGSFNGTAYGGPYGQGDIVRADLDIGPTVAQATIQIISYMPTVPTKMSDTVRDLNVTSWEAVMARLPAVAALDTQYNVTLFLPPEPVVSASLNLSDSDLASFYASHIVPQRLTLPMVGRNVSTSGGAGAVVGVSIGGGVVGSAGRRAVVVGDVVCDGGIIQAIDGPLVALPGEAHNATKRHEEL